MRASLDAVVFSLIVSPERRHAIRPDQFPTEEQLKDYTINQALAGDTDLPPENYTIGLEVHLC